jgi:hypothetical protein
LDIWQPCFTKVQTDKAGKYEYELAFDLNQRDAEGQTVLYLATCVGNLKIVELVIGFRLRARKIIRKTDEAASAPAMSGAAARRGRMKLPDKPKLGISRDDTGEVAVARQQLNKTVREN